MKPKWNKLMEEVDDLFSEGSGDETTQVVETPQEPQKVEGPDLSAAIAEGFARVTQSLKAPEQPKQISQEDLDKELGVWNPDDEEVEEISQALMNPEATVEQKRKALLKLRDGLVGQSVKTATLGAEEKVRQLQTQMSPAMEVMVAEQRRKAEDAFYGRFPELKDFSEVVVAVGQSVVQKEMAERQAGRPGHQGDLQELVAQRVAEVIKKVNPDFVVSDTTKGQPKTGSAPRPASTNVSGVRGTPSGGKPQNKGTMSIWDD